MKSTIVLGIGATLLASCSGNRQKAEEKVTQQQKKPNVIFLIADDIGYGDLSCNGSKTIHTPNVERLAAQGVRFTDAHAVAATSTPSRYSFGKSSPLRSIKPCSSRNDMDALSIALPFGCKITAKKAPLEQMHPRQPLQLSATCCHRI